MSTVFETLSDKFYIAFFESDSEKRRVAIEAWIKDATPIVQSAVESELRLYLEYILEQTWTNEGWQSRAKKFCGTTQDSRQRRPSIIPFIDGYQLRLDLRLSHPWDHPRGEKVQVVGSVSPETHADVLRIAQQTLLQIEPTKVVTNLLPQSNHSGNADEDDDYNDDDGERTSNDDRSDSMNPNNDDYQASMDNRSDQMNPNNDAYWSSRGR